MSPPLLLLAADMLHHKPARGCSDHRLPADLSDADVAEIVRLANRANFGNRMPHADNDVETTDGMRRGTHDFIVIAALAEGLREMAKGLT